jgi:hypothetical protein
MIPKIKNLIREKRALDIIIFYEEKIINSGIKI